MRRGGKGNKGKRKWRTYGACAHTRLYSAAMEWGQCSENSSLCSPFRNVTPWNKGDVYARPTRISSVCTTKRSTGARHIFSIPPLPPGPRKTKREHNASMLFYACQEGWRYSRDGISFFTQLEVTRNEIQSRWVKNLDHSFVKVYSTVTSIFQVRR